MTDLPQLIPLEGTIYRIWDVGHLFGNHMETFMCCFCESGINVTKYDTPYLLAGWCWNGGFTFLCIHSKVLIFSSSTRECWRPNIYNINGLSKSSVEKADFHKKTPNNKVKIGLEYSIRNGLIIWATVVMPYSSTFSRIQLWLAILVNSCLMSMEPFSFTVLESLDWCDTCQIRSDFLILLWLVSLTGDLSRSCTAGRIQGRIQSVLSPRASGSARWKANSLSQESLHHTVLSTGFYVPLKLLSEGLQ